MPKLVVCMKLLLIGDWSIDHHWTCILNDCIKIQRIIWQISKKKQPLSMPMDKVMVDKWATNLQSSNNRKKICLKPFRPQRDELIVDRRNSKRNSKFRQKFNTNNSLSFSFCDGHQRHRFAPLMWLKSIIFCSCLWKMIFFLSRS